jgi:short subunit fatty acids transporter
MDTRTEAEEGMTMFIIISIVMLSGLLIYVLLKPPHAQERAVRIAHKEAQNDEKYELSIMSISEIEPSQK